MKRTKEEKAECLKDAIAMYKEIVIAADKCEAMFKRAGVELCDIVTRKDAIHVYEGMKKIENITGIKMEHPTDWCGTKDMSTMEIVIDGIHLFELGKAAARKFK